jgi:hypothetical protein
MRFRRKKPGTPKTSSAVKKLLMKPSSFPHNPRVLETTREQGLIIIDDISTILRWEAPTALIDIRKYEIAYHGTENIYAGSRRTLCTVSEQGYGCVMLRIRTTDKEPDKQLLKRLTGLLSFRRESDTTQLNSTIKLHEYKGEKSYHISIGKIPVEDLKKAMEAVDRVGKILLEEKEMVQCPGDDSKRLLSELSSS